MRNLATVITLALCSCNGSKTTGAGGAAATTSTATSSSTGATPTSSSGTGSSSVGSATTTTATGGFDPSKAPSTLGSFTTQGSTGCAKAGAMTNVQQVSGMVGGVNRTSTVFVPTDYDPEKAYPIVFVFHGDGGTGASIRTSLDLEPDANGKAIFAYPDGLQQTWDATEVGNNDDMNWVLALRDTLRASYCTDMKRTFLTGMSRGGFFVNQLACRYGIAEFAAIAPHSSTIDPGSGSAYIYGPSNPNGGPYMEMGNYDFACPSDGNPPPTARPILPPPAFVIHGECDQEGGVEFPEGRRVVEHWGFAADCSTTPAVVVTTNPNPTCNGGALTSNPILTTDPCYVAPGCKPGHDITFCAIPSMDHRVWADAHSRIWSFFAAH